MTEIRFKSVVTREGEGCFLRAVVDAVSGQSLPDFVVLERVHASFIHMLL